jgi:hypothetical protein
MQVLANDACSVVLFCFLPSNHLSEKVVTRMMLFLFMSKLLAYKLLTAEEIVHQVILFVTRLIAQQISYTELE